MSDNTARRDHRGVDGAVSDAVKGKGKGKPASKKVTAKKRGPSVSDALKGETKGSKGERSFGTPIKDQHTNQSTDSNQ